VSTIVSPTVQAPAPEPAPRRGPAALFELMREQHGVASRPQARAVGVSRAVERRLVAEGALVRPVGEVLAVGGVWPSFASRCMATSLLAGVQAISHGAAARLHRLPGFEQHESLDAIGRRGARLHHPPPVVTHRSRRDLDDHIVRVARIPVTSIPLTLVLLAGTVDDRVLSRALDDAIRRGIPAAPIEELARRWRVSGRIDAMRAMGP